ncbi:MAG TPA: HAD-IIIC family phosphatase [Ferruginibacter sp.]|nr:HAD-IIIC family phosphatase [Ferruginibacter sp.]HPH91771.1 HAD-IIIC family phosphatase [Ferruginibacter sp.]
MQTFAALKKNLKKDYTGLVPLKLALLGDSATQLLSQALRGAAYDEGFDLQIWEADFGQVERQVFDEGSELYAFEPSIVVIFQSAHKLLGTYNKLKPEAFSLLADNRMDLVGNMYSQLKEKLNARIIYYNYTEINDAVFGSYSNKVASSFPFQLRKLNYRLMEFAAATPDFFVCDLSTIQNQYGKSAIFQSSIYINTEMVLSVDTLPEVAVKTLDIIKALNGRFKKCVILDLDNTTWGGIIGDDGLENIQIGSLGIGKAFSEFQYWVKKLQKRGIIVAVCSKNTERIAKEPFEKHPDMVLRLEDIAVFVANWETKVDNIRHIQSILNIGFDSMVFLDDNPFERNIVRENIAGITVPELPEDPAEYLEYLYTLNLFETVSYSGEDAERTKQYQVEAQRAVLQKSFGSEDEFLQSLEMVSVVEPFTKFNTPRVAQLSQRSNQFNLRTVRYTEADIESMADNNAYAPFTFTLVDKFGDNGLICIIILKKESADTLFIETWLMSCRVLKRGMEDFTLNTIVNYAKDNGFAYLKGEYIPTPKNEMVKDHFKKLGFREAGSYWQLDVAAHENKKCFIVKKSNND